MKDADLAQDKKLIKRAIAMHDKQEHKGEKTNLSKLRKGGNVKKMAAGGQPDPKAAAMMARKRQAMMGAAPTMGRPMAPTGAPAPTVPMKKGGVAKTVTKEMEYDYKTGKKSFPGTTAQRDRHAEKEGKMVAKHAAFDRAMGMKKGGMKKMASGGMTSMGSVKTKPGNINGVAERGLTKGKTVKMSAGGSGKRYC